MTSAYLTGSYDHGLVVLSAVIAVLSSYTALDLAGRLTSAGGLARTCWLVGGATALEAGIWPTHFTAMLAFRLPAQVLYDWPTVLLSLLPRIVCCGLALFVVSRKTMGQLQAFGARFFLGGGLAGRRGCGFSRRWRLGTRVPHISPAFLSTSATCRGLTLELGGGDV